MLLVLFASFIPITLSRAPLFSSLNFRGGKSAFDNHVIQKEVPDSFLTSGDSQIGIRQKFERVCRDAQNSICSALEELDGVGKFKTDVWSRSDGGGGVSRVMSGGKVFEKAGVNVAVVYGTMPAEALRAATERGFNRAQNGATKATETAQSISSHQPKKIPFFACGISSVLHPKNPYCPTMHFNYRYFETAGGTWWFGGGTDITPSYLNDADMKHFHTTYKTVCDKHDPNFYPKFKKWADDYFRITHRDETRGLGGIFYDDLDDREPEKLLEFAKDGLAAVIPAYAPIIREHMNDPYSQRQKEWQQIRRGRYVEFNLVYDRGTTFGLKTGGRVESILMSLPETARWEYNLIPQEVYGQNSPEAMITDAFRHPREWV